MRVHIVGHLFLAIAVLVMYLAIHALPCLAEHPDPHPAHSVSVAHEHPVDDCHSGSVPHASEHPHCMVASRTDDGDLLALPALPLLALVGLIDPTRRPRAPSCPASRSGRATLLTFCVSRC
ncbi:hypothetical protein [Actinophytocola sp. NPDC049390]|uniref:hypothetical protein n=1 Tax=Actinophytocola sp. NPDC049390 TaxID=3363894 RepID=UPI00378D72A4